MSRFKNLVRLFEVHTKAASKILAQAFYDYPSYDYLFPNVNEKYSKVPLIHEFLVRYGIMYGEVYSSSPNFEGIAIWLPFWKSDFTQEKRYMCGGRELDLSLGLDWQEQHDSIEKCEYSCHKQHANFFHWYLFPIGVDPIYQGKGYVSLLLRAKFAEMDKKSIPCYLETNKEKNVSLYQHFGFKVVEEGIIPDTDIPYWAMLRKKK